MRVVRGALEDALTLAECLVLYRRRQKQTQTVAAELIGIPLWEYREIEAGALDADAYCHDVRRALEWRANKIRADVTDEERCRIARRRSGMTPEEVARKAGVSRQYLYLMEGGRAPVDRLLAFWTRQ